MQKRFDVRLIFYKGGSYRCRFYARSRVSAKVQAIRWARDCGFVGAIKKAEVIEIAIEIAGAGNVSSASNVGG
jgi:hypothetical protein